MNTIWQGLSSDLTYISQVLATWLKKRERLIDAAFYVSHGSGLVDCNKPTNILLFKSYSR